MFIEQETDTLHTVSDTLTNHSSEGGSDWILHHVMDSRTLDFQPLGEIHIPQLPLLFGLDITPTKHVIFMWISAILLIVIFSIVAGKYKKSLVPKGIASFFELLVLFVKDEIVAPTLGKETDRYLPYLLTIFFFILFGNFIGLVPFSATFTSNLAVTAALAICTFFMTQLAGIRSYGFFGYFKGLIPHGMPVFILPLMVLVELLGLFTKPFALSIRLFANMIAGHVVILSLIGLIFILGTAYVAPVSIAFSLFIYLLEILVALIQAYIFTMLSSLFISMAAHQEH